MKYLKLYENYTNDDDDNQIDTKELLEEILLLDYILKNEGVNVNYHVRQNLNGMVNMYQIGKSDSIIFIDNKPSLIKVEELEKDDDFPKKIYCYEIRFESPSVDLVNEYFNKLVDELDDYNKKLKENNINPVKVEKFIDYRYKPELRPYNPIIKVVVEKTIDDYGKNGADEDDVNESIDYEKYDGLEPEYIYDMFFDLTDTNTFPESIKLNVDFNNRWSKVGGSIKKPRIENKPIIEVTLKLENIDIPEYGLTQAKKQSITDIIKNVKENKVFKDVITIANKRLRDYDWSIDNVSDDFGSREIKIVIKKI